LLAHAPDTLPGKRAIYSALPARPNVVDEKVVEVRALP
jgi:hypothetical protein